LQAWAGDIVAAARLQLVYNVTGKLNRFCMVIGNELAGYKEHNIIFH